MAADPTKPHEFGEDDPWRINIPGHLPRKDTPEYRESRSRLHDLVGQIGAPFYGPEPVEDHHGGGLWLKDEDGWFMVRNLAGIEWSAQFCADPAKVDKLRQVAKRLYAKFSGAKELGIEELLEDEITDADGVQRWTDSICNASVPLPHLPHSGTLPEGGGVHHYPSPIVEIEFFKQDDFELWVNDEAGHRVAVAPMGERGSGDGRVQVLYAPEDSSLRAPLERAHARGHGLYLEPDHPIAQRAFKAQNNKGRQRRGGAA